MSYSISINTIRCEKKPTEKFHAFVDLCCKGELKDYISYSGFIRFKYNIGIKLI